MDKDRGDADTGDYDEQEFREEISPSGRKVYIRTTTRKSISTSSSAADLQTPTPVRTPQRGEPTFPTFAGDDEVDFVVEQQASGRVIRRFTTKTTSSVHRTLVTSSGSITPVHSSFVQQQQHQPIHSYSDNDSLLEDPHQTSVCPESASFHHIHKFTTHYNESTPLSSPISGLSSSGTDSLYRSLQSHSSPLECASPVSGQSQHNLTDDWTFNKTHQYQTKSGFFRSISEYDSHIKEIRGESATK